MTLRAPGNKYIVGWLEIDPAHRAEFCQLAKAYAEACREEDGCLFFELVPHHQDPGRVLVAEAFASEDAHAWHLEQDHFQTMAGHIRRLCRAGHFENVIAASVQCDDISFAARGENACVEGREDIQAGGRSG